MHAVLLLRLLAVLTLRNDFLAMVYVFGDLVPKRIRGNALLGHS